MKSQMVSLVAQMQDGGILYEEAVREFRKVFITSMLQRHGGNQCKTARALGVHRNTVTRAIVELGIAAKRPRGVAAQYTRTKARTA